MDIGFMQFAPVLGNLDATIRTIDHLSGQLPQGGLTVLPELSNSGYNFESREQAMEASEETGAGRFVAFLHDLCRRTDGHIVSGVCERDGERLYNSSVLVGPEGLVGKYRKLHLFLNEKDIFTPGDCGLPVFEAGECRVGMLICFDWAFPEAWRILALNGADIICHPSNLVLPGLGQKVASAHAITNRVYVVTANRVGTERNLTFTGNSIVCNPGGELLREASTSGECVLFADVDLSAARNKMVTPRNHLFEDRRPQEYTKLTD
jgi:predicted amidohydrolase